MARKLLLLVTILCLCGLALPALGTVFVKVGGVGNGSSWANAFGQIQFGIEAAFAIGGDQVWVAAGTYEKVLILREGVKLYGGFKGNEANLSDRPAFPRPAPDPFASIIDGKGTGSAVTMAFALTSNTIISGFTITNGYNDYGGGGILCFYTNPIISQNIITGNGGSRGAGIYCVGGAATISDNLITDNFADAWGGGICCEAQAKPFIGYNTISNNSAAYYGAGIDCECQSSPCILSNNILGNSAGFDGGGIFVFDGSSPSITANWIIGNTADLYGGGIYCANSSPPITRNLITSNKSLLNGGGIYIYDHSSPTVTDNIIAGNTAKEYGGGICVWWYSLPILTNNTIASNIASKKGGGIAYAYKSSANTWNNIVAFNSSGLYSYTSTPIVRFNCVYNPAGANYTGLTPAPGSGNISVDPLFVNLALGDYHLTAPSPCVNTGFNTAPAIPPVDYAGFNRIVGARVDMGAYESAFLSPIRR
ncbi:MAG: right-handed parallel beta-helix repeat-containing protein [Armatimonadetes bacterium]|nr:right-handed parallel beta-helix repeat-containing protein [Armatimonadota bacterium]